MRWFRTRSRPTCSARRWTSRPRSTRASPRTAPTSTAPGSTTTRSSRSCAAATTPGSDAAAWEAGKQIGAEVAGDVRELARLRNEAARTLGYRDHFALALATSALDEARLFATLDEVDQLTAGPFAAWKAELDDAARRSIRHRPRRPRAVAPRRPVLPGPADRRRGRPRSVLRRRRPRGAHSPHVRRPRPRHRSGARTPATSTHATTRTSTPSASTSTARATCVSSATSSPTSAGPTRCSTSSATRCTTASSIRTSRGCCASRRTRSPPRASR